MSPQTFFSSSRGCEQVSEGNATGSFTSKECCCFNTYRRHFCPSFDQRSEALSTHTTDTCKDIAKDWEWARANSDSKKTCHHGLKAAQAKACENGNVFPGGRLANLVTAAACKDPGNPCYDQDLCREVGPDTLSATEASEHSKPTLRYWRGDHAQEVCCHERGALNGGALRGGDADDADAASVCAAVLKNERTDYGNQDAYHTPFKDCGQFEDPNCQDGGAPIPAPQGSSRTSGTQPVTTQLKLPPPHLPSIVTVRPTQQPPSQQQPSQHNFAPPPQVFPAGAGSSRPSSSFGAHRLLAPHPGGTRKP